MSAQSTGIQLGGFNSKTCPLIYEVIQKQDKSSVTQQHHQKPKSFPFLPWLFDHNNVAPLWLQGDCSSFRCDMQAQLCPAKKRDIFHPHIYLYYGEKNRSPNTLSFRSPALHGLPPPPLYYLPNHGSYCTLGKLVSSIFRLYDR